MIYIARVRVSSLMLILPGVETHTTTLRVNKENNEKCRTLLASPTQLTWANLTSIVLLSGYTMKALMT